MAIDHAASGEVVDVRPLGPQLTDAISTALFKSEQLEVMRIVLRAGQAIPEHHIPGEMTIQCIEGAVEVHAHQRAQVLEAGRLMRLEGNVPYEFHAVENCSLLVTMSMLRDPDPAKGQQ